MGILPFGIMDYLEGMEFLLRELFTLYNSLWNEMVVMLVFLVKSNGFEKVRQRPSTASVISFFRVKRSSLLFRLMISKGVTMWPYLVSLSYLCAFSYLS